MTPFRAKSGPTLWILAFYKKVESAWWRPFIPGRFKHVGCVGFDPLTDQWLYADWARDGLVIRAITQDELVAFTVWIRNQGGKMLECEVEFERRIALFRGPVYCVTLAKHLLGWSSWALTPQQLYNLAIKKGGRPVFEGK